MPRLSPLTYSLAFVLLCYGLVMFTFGPCLTAISETFHIPLGQTGLIFTFLSAGLLPSVLVTGFLSERLGKRPLLLGAVVSLGLGSALFAGSPGSTGAPIFAYALAAMVVIGIGAGGIESVGNALIADENQPTPAFAMNFAHAFFAVGAVVGPAAVGLLLRAHHSWQFAFYGAAAALAILMLALVAMPWKAPKSEPMAMGAALGLLRLPLLWLLLIVLAMYVGAEVGISAWVSPLMEKTLGASRATAAAAVSAFWGCMIVGRLVTSWLSTRLPSSRLIIGLATGSVLGGLGVAFSPSVGACLAMSAFSGLFMSGMFGMVATDAAHAFPERSGAVFGVLVFGVGLGALITPAAMGWASSAGSLRLAMLIPPALMALVVLAYVLPWTTLGRPTGNTRGEPNRERGIRRQAS
jgi:fucose permease